VPLTAHSQAPHRAAQPARLICFVMLVLTLVPTAAIVTVVMFRTLTWLS
jgi:hypothetical protein